MSKWMNGRWVCCLVWLRHPMLTRPKTIWSRGCRMPRRWAPSQRLAEKCHTEVPLFLPCSFWPSLHSPPARTLSLSLPSIISQMLPSEHDGYIHPLTPHRWVWVALHTRTSLSDGTIVAIVISCLVHHTVLTSQPPPHLFNQSNHFMVEAGHACSLLRILQWLPITFRTQDNVLRIK